MSNLDLLHASICVALGIIGVAVMTIAVHRSQWTSDQPDWGAYKDSPARARIPGRRQRFLMGAIVFAATITALGSLVTFVVASR